MSDLQIELPDYDYTPWMGTSGMSTKHFGPALWNFLFISVLGGYPIKIDNDNLEHIQIKKAFYETITNLQYTLPCIFCRESYKIFINELKIESYLKGRIELCYWIYLIKDKVNKKLIKQENDYIKYQTKKYKKLYRIGKFDLDMLSMKLYKLDVMKKTIPSPSFIEVLKHYEIYRAICKPDLKKCIQKKI